MIGTAVAPTAGVDVEGGPCPRPARLPFGARSGARPASGARHNRRALPPSGRAGKVKVPEENAAAALEVMSRFAVDPRCWSACTVRVRRGGGAARSSGRAREPARGIRTWPGRHGPDGAHGEPPGQRPRVPRRLRGLRAPRHPGMRASSSSPLTSSGSRPARPEGASSRSPCWRSSRSRSTRGCDAMSSAAELPHNLRLSCTSSVAVERFIVMKWMPGAPSSSIR